MEGILLEVAEIGFGISFTMLLGLIGIFSGIAFRWMAVEERRGVRLTWAEWPLPETAPPAAEKEKVRLAA